MKKFKYIVLLCLCVIPCGITLSTVSACIAEKMYLSAVFAALLASGPVASIAAICMAYHNERKKPLIIFVKVYWAIILLFFLIGFLYYQ